MQISAPRLMRAAVATAIASLWLTATALATPTLAQGPTLKLGTYKGTTSQGVKATIDVQRADAGYYLIATPGIGLQIKERCSESTSSSVAYFQPTVAVLKHGVYSRNTLNGFGDREIAHIVVRTNGTLSGTIQEIEKGNVCNSGVVRISAKHR
jgi:hypothetical protein